MFYFIVKKTAIIILLVMLWIVPVIAAPRNADGISFELHAGTVTGKTSEYVFEKNKCISRLDWDEKCVPYVGINSRVQLWNCVLLAGVTSIIPDRCGEMEDYDFLITGTTEPSNFSKHNAYLDKHVTAFALTGYTFNICGSLSIAPVVGIEYQNRKWTAQDGYLQYPVDGSVWTGSEPKQNTAGMIISYEQMFYYPLVCMEMIYNVSSILSISAEGCFFPLVHVETIDNHFLRLKRFYDTMDKGMGYKAGLGMCIYPHSAGTNIFYVLNASFSYFRAMKGKTSSGIIGISDGSLTTDNGYSSGTRSSLWDVSFGIITKIIF